jgi:hypothetical protein
MSLAILGSGCMRHRPSPTRTEKTSKTEKTATASDPAETVVLPPLPGQSPTKTTVEPPATSPGKTSPPDDPLVPVGPFRTPAEQPPLSKVDASGWISADKPLSVPAPRPEIAPPAPSADRVWIAGQWERQPDHWLWVDGHWTSVPFLGAYWHKGYWKQVQGRYVWHPAHWAAASQGLVVNKPITPPPLPTETMPPPPNPSHRWVPGHWDWQGVWIYIPGHFTLAPHPKAKWVSGRWTKGLLDNWRWVSGHWEL